MPDGMPLAEGDLRIHVFPDGIQVWAGAVKDGGQLGWKEVGEAEPHPTLGATHVLTLLGGENMP